MTIWIGGTDIMDQRVGQKTTSTLTPRWVVKFLEFMLDQTSINAQSLFGLLKGYRIDYRIEYTYYIFV